MSQQVGTGPSDVVRPVAVGRESRGLAADVDARAALIRLIDSPFSLVVDHTDQHFAAIRTFCRHFYAHDQPRTQDVGKGADYCFWGPHQNGVPGGNYEVKLPQNWGLAGGPSEA